MNGNKASILAWLALGFALATAAGAANTTTVTLANGAKFAIKTQFMEPAPGAAPREYIPFSGLGYVLRQMDGQARWDWDARFGHLRVAVADQRFSLSARDNIVVVNGSRRPVNLPIRFADGDIWIPIPSVLLISSAIEGLQIEHTQGQAVLEPIPTPGVTSPTAASPEEEILPQETLTAPPGPELPPLDSRRAGWKVILATLPVGSNLKAPGVPPVGSALDHMAGRAASLLSEEGSMQPILLTTRSAGTTVGQVLQDVVRQSPDMVVFLRLEVSPLLQAPAYTIYYADESVDSHALARSRGDGSSGAWSLSYLPFQTGNRQMAEALAEALTRIEGFRHRQTLPAPMYLLKRCPARAILLVLSFPSSSPELGRMADSAFREGIARAVAGALLEYFRERLQGGEDRSLARRGQL